MSRVPVLRPGVKMAANEAKAYVDHLYFAMYAHWEKKIPKSPFMTQLEEGTLPMPVIRQFFKNWGHFALDVNALNALSPQCSKTQWSRSGVSSRLTYNHLLATTLKSSTVYFTGNY